MLMASLRQNSFIPLTQHNIWSSRSCLWPFIDDCMVAALTVGVLQPQTKIPCCWNGNPLIQAKELQLKCKTETEIALFFFHCHIIDGYCFGSFPCGMRESKRGIFIIDTSVK